MTDLVLAVRLKADGSGLVGTLQLSKAETDKLTGAFDKAEDGARQLAGGTAAAGVAAREMAGAVGAAGAAAAEFARDQRQVAQATSESSKRLRDQEAAQRKAAAEANRHAFGVRNLGQQFGDLGLSIAGGISPARAFGQQAGQIGYAMSEMGGKMGRVGAFLTGPWGIALTVAAAVLAPLVEKLIEGENAAEEFLDAATKAATAADSFGSAQSLLGKIIDTTTGKLKTQNTVLVEAIRLQAMAGIAKAREDQRQAGKALETVGRPTFGERASGAANIGGGNLLTTLLGGAATALTPDDPRLTNIADRFRNGALGIREARIEVEKLGLSSAAANKELLKFVAYGSAVNDEKANQLVLDAVDGKGIDPALKPYEKGKKGPKPKSTAARDEFGRDAGDRIATIAERFEETPGVVRQANAAIRQLDDLIDDLGRKKPPGFETLIASAEQAKTTVRDGLLRELTRAFDKPETLAGKAAEAFGQLDAVIADLEKRQPPGFEQLIAGAREARSAVEEGLNRPYNEFIDAQEDALRVQRLINQGRGAEAEALRIVQGLEQTIGQELTPERRKAVLATVEALRAEEAQTRRIEVAMRRNLDAVAGIRDVLQQATQDFVRGDLGQLIKSPGRLLDVFQTIKGQELFDGLFGGALSDLEDQINGVSPVREAAERMGDAVDAVSRATDRTTSALDALGRSARNAASGVSGKARDPFFSGVEAGADMLGGVDGEATVTAGRAPRRQLDTRSLFSSAATSVATAVLGGKNITDRNRELAGLIGSKVGTAFDGSATGGFIAGVGKSLGLKMSGTGAQIGGAIGSLLPIPGGDIIGSILGGTIGGLFTKTKKASATVGAVNGEASVTGVTGNSASYRSAASGLGGSVADGIASVIEALGGELGNFAVSIGQRKKKFVVDSSGSGRTKGGGTQSFASEAEAVAAALFDAIGDGAVAGISAAMQQALRSSPDIDRGVREALKVREVERLIEGTGGQLKQVFADFDRTAADRVRIAQKYGLDLLAVEKANAEQRTALVDDALKSRVGSLKDFLSSVSYGDLFEGSAADRRSAILSEIGDARQDADNGVEGASDRVAELYRQLISTSRDAFGTAGPEFGADRAAGVADVQRLLKAEEDRVKAAAAQAQATTDAVLEVGRQVDETNDLQAIANRYLATIAGAIGGGGGGGSAMTDSYAGTYRNVALV